MRPPRVLCNGGGVGGGGVGCAMRRMSFSGSMGLRGVGDAPLAHGQTRGCVQRVIGTVDAVGAARLICMLWMHCCMCDRRMLCCVRLCGPSLRPLRWQRHVPPAVLALLCTLTARAPHRVVTGQGGLLRRPQVASAQ
jgi:hypothetical protein